MLVFELDFLIEFGLLRDLSLEKSRQRIFVVTLWTCSGVKSHNSGQHFYQAICYFDHWHCQILKLNQKMDGATTWNGPIKSEGHSRLKVNIVPTNKVWYKFHSWQYFYLWYIFVSVPVWFLSVTGFLAPALSLCPDNKISKLDNLGRLRRNRIL